MQRGALRRNANFVNLWGAATVSTFGSFITGTALPFTAILLLDASPFAIGVLRIAEMLPALSSDSSPGPGSIASPASQS